MTDTRKIRRLLLLFPPVRLASDTMKVASFPLGVGYLAAVTRDMAEVEIMDAVAESEHHHYMGGDFTWYGSPLSDIKQRIERFRPDMVGMTCIFSSVFPVVREICRTIKEIDRHIMTVTGGTYPTFMPEYCLAEPALDMIARGEGETVLVDLLAALEKGAPLREVDGLAWKENNEVRVNPKTKWVEDLDRLPFPARDLLPTPVYKKRGVPHSLSISGRTFSPLITSRGCPANCIYCSSTRFWGNRYRFRSAQNVLDEIGELVERFGIEEVQFEDDNMTANKKRATEIFEGIIERGYDIRFNFPNGLALWTLDEKLVDLMVKAGCYEMTLAFESGSQKVLSEIVKKPTDLEKAARIADYIRSSGIRTDAFYIIGFPGETREQIQETFDFARKMKTDMAYFFVANPLPGTEMYEMARQQGLLREDFNFEDLSYSRSAYHSGVFNPGELEKMAARGFLKHSIRSFFRRPLVISRRFIVDLLLKRPRYTFGILVRIWRRNVKPKSV